MTIRKIIDDYDNSKIIPETTIREIQHNPTLRNSIIPYFRTTNNRDFALALHDRLVTMRQRDEVISGEDIMLAAYIVGLHGHIEDSIAIWKAKETDFDTFCMVDIQLTVFAGVRETLGYLKNDGSDAAAEAYTYITGCAKAGDFDEFDEYFSEEETPWFV